MGALEWVLLVSAAANAVAVLAILRLSGRRGDVRTLESTLREEIRADREARERTAREDREEWSRALGQQREAAADGWERFERGQRAAMDSLVSRLVEADRRSEERQERIRGTLEKRLESLQQGNEAKLDAMRKTVDETLQSTLERRLGESFKMVAGSLEAVQRGLGEMQELAAGVGDLKRVLTNVKSRGTWGEVQLGALLEQVLSSGQYGRNVAIRPGSRDFVEFAVRLPGRDEDDDRPVWLPIDAKFPQEDYLRLQEASEAGDPEAVRVASAALARAIKLAAREVRDKYVAPPHSTDFAILYLPTEGLYAEALRHEGLVESLQRELRIVIAGPTTLTALLNSLQMGFRTLALERRSSEVWKILASVKTEFRRFEGVLTRVRKQLQTAARTIDETGVRTRAMERKLRDVEALPEDASEASAEGSNADDSPEDAPPDPPSRRPPSLLEESWK